MNRKTLYAFITSFLLLIVVIILNRLSFQELRKYAQQVDHTRHVITVFERISNEFKSAQLYTSAPDLQMEWYKAEADSIPFELTQLRVLVRDNPSQTRRTDSLNQLLTHVLPRVLKTPLADNVGASGITDLVAISKIHLLINDGISEEEGLLLQRKARLNDYTSISNLITTAFAVIAAAIMIFTFLSIFLLSRRRIWLEGFLTSILNTSRNGIMHIHAIREHGKIVDFKIVYINKSLYNLLSLKNKDYLNMRLTEIPSHTRGPNLMKEYEKVTETGQPAEVEVYYERDDFQCWLMASLAKLDDGVIASYQDITQLKRYENTLKENIADLERSNTELEEYAYVASHDLQEPLRKIRSFGSYLQDTQSERMDEKGRSHLSKIVNAAERMSSLIKDILNFSGTKRENEIKEVDLEEVFQNVLQDLDLMIAQKNARINHQKLPVIEGIPLQMHQLFYNLVNNSLKFSAHDRAPEINLFCRAVTEDEKPSGLRPGIYYIEINFSDNGIGFSSEYSEQIFGMFKRLNDKHFYPGSGIGLALCRKVVANHHGLISAEGREGSGATFHIYLPRTQSLSNKGEISGEFNASQTTSPDVQGLEATR